MGKIGMWWCGDCGGTSNDGDDSIFRSHEQTGMLLENMKFSWNTWQLIMCFVTVRCRRSEGRGVHGNGVCEDDDVVGML